jgi:hypothetical protein
MDFLAQNVIFGIITSSYIDRLQNLERKNVLFLEKLYYVK